MRNQCIKGNRERKTKTKRFCTLVGREDDCETTTIIKAKTTAPKTSQDKRQQKPERIKYKKGEQVGKGVDQFKRDMEEKNSYRNIFIMNTKIQRSSFICQAINEDEKKITTVLESK